MPPMHENDPLHPSSFILYPSSFSESFGRQLRLIRKELREILRDRRTILTLVLMPLLLYPLMGIAFNQFYQSHLVSMQVPEYRLGFTSEREAVLVLHFLQQGEQILAARRSAAESGPRHDPVTADDLDLAVRDASVHLGIRVRNLAEAERPGGTLDCELLYREDSAIGMEAVVYVESRVAAANTFYLERQLQARGVRRAAAPVRLTRAPVRDTMSKGSVSLAAVVPLMLILMTITGAVYPAIDLTAGERERDTLEILMTAPVPRMGLLFAKYVAVVTVALLTALVNLVSMVLTIHVTGLAARFGGMSPLTLLEVFGLLVLFAAFFSGVLLILTSFARSFKEAQAYLIPLMLVALIPGMLGIVPGIGLTPELALVPLLNIVLLAHDLFTNSAAPVPAGIVVASTLIYALAAVSLAARIFGAEGVLYGSQGRWRDRFRRASIVPNP